MKDGRSDPGHSRKRPQRADGRNRSEGQGRRAESGARSGGARRDDRARPEPEPGFGPFRGSGRPNRKRNDEARTVRSAAEEAVARASGESRPALRIVKGTGSEPAPKPKSAGRGKPVKRGAPSGGTAGQRPKPVRDSGRFQEALTRGARALDRGYENEALRILRPYRELFPDNVDLRELLGLTYYRLGKWAAAQKELDVYVGLTDSTGSIPSSGTSPGLSGSTSGWSSFGTSSGLSHRGRRS